jgi:hypothetical protein
MAMNDPQHSYPTLSQLGPKMIGGNLEWQDYYSATLPMGNFRIMLQNWVDGNGWSGNEPPTGPATAYVRSASFHPLHEGAAGTANTDYGAPTFAVNASAWTAENWRYELMKNFRSVMAGNPQFANTQTNNPNLVKWENAPDGTPALSLGLTPIQHAPAVDFFYLTPDGAPGNLDTYVAAEVDLPGQSYAMAAFPTGDAFWGPLNTPIPVKVWFVNDPSKTCTAHIILNGDGTWTAGQTDQACSSVMGAPGTKYSNNTVGIGRPHFGP